jgi:putative sigma-54 modulation protein
MITLNLYPMKVNTQSVNFNADGKLIDFIQKRLDKLELFYDRVISSDVYLKVVNTSSKENKIVEIKVHIPKDLFVVKKRCKTFEEAVDSACSSLERKLVKKKQKPRVQTSLKFL